MKSKKLPLQRYKNILNKKIVGYVLHIKIKVLYLLHETFIFIARPEKKHVPFSVSRVSSLGKRFKTGLFLIMI